MVIVLELQIHVFDYTIFRFTASYLSIRWQYFNLVSNAYITYNALTQWGRDKMAAILQTVFSNDFSWMKMYKFRLKFHQSFITVTS